MSVLQVMRPSDETTAWSRARTAPLSWFGTFWRMCRSFFGRIEKRATVRSTKQKGRCLFINEALNAARLCILDVGLCPEIIRSLPFDEGLYHPSCSRHIDTLSADQILCVFYTSLKSLVLALAVVA